MKIFEANVIKVETDRKPGSIISVDKKGLCIACKNNVKAKDVPYAELREDLSKQKVYFGE